MSTSQSNAPEGILCSKTHEWALEDGNNIIIGLTDYAIEQLGDIVFVELPEVGSEFVKMKCLQQLNLLRLQKKFICRLAVRL